MDIKKTLIIVVAAVALLVIVYFNTKKKAKATGIEEGNKYANDAMVDGMGANTVQDYFYKDDLEKQEQINSLLGEYLSITGKSAAGKYNTVAQLQAMINEAKALRQLKKEYDELTGTNLDVTLKENDTSSEVQGLITAYKMQKESNWNAQKVYLKNKCTSLKEWGQLKLKEMVSSTHYPLLKEIANLNGSDAVYFVRYYDNFISKYINKSGVSYNVELGCKDINNLFDFCYFWTVHHRDTYYLKKNGFPYDIVENIQAMVEQVYENNKNLADIDSCGNLL